MTEVQLNDGVAAVAAGDALVLVYKTPARVHRSRWCYDLADALAEKRPGGIVILLVVLSSSDPPDAPTRVENARRMRALAGKLRTLVTVPVGDDMWLNIVRSVMRLTTWMQGKSASMPVTATLERGIDALLEARSSETPSRETLMELVRGLYRELDVPPP
jgi:hypothetical protein